MTEGIKAIIYPVRDLAKAKTLYGKLLDVEPDMDEPYYVGFNVGGQDVGRVLSATGTLTTSREA
jgi:hypothetical protein